MVIWKELAIDEMKDRIVSKVIPFSNMLDGISSIGTNNELIVDASGTNCTIPIKEILQDFTRPWQIMNQYSEGDDVLNLVRKLYTRKDAPSYKFDVVKGKNSEEGDTTILFERLDNPDKRQVSIKDFVHSLDTTKLQEKFSYSRLGVDFKGTAEMQILSRTDRKEVELHKGDYLDPGIFLRFNRGMDKVSVSPGVYRLICTNGLTRKMFVWESKFEDIFNSQQLIDDSINLMTWLIDRKNDKVKSIRELAVIIMDKCPSKLINLFWIDWASRIELGSLTYFDVISDLTSSVNDTLSSTRYDLLSFPVHLDEFRSSSHHCPKCSALVGV